MTAEQVIEEIVHICNDKEVRAAYLFGSRAKGTNRERSDIDIAVCGAKDFELLRECIDEIPTLFTVDLVNMDTCGNELLLEDIREYGRKIYEKV